MNDSSSTTETLPAYPDPSKVLSPHAHAFPTSFRIGTTDVNLLVTPEHLKGHLSILRTFHTLRSTIENANDDRIPPWAKKMDPGRRWSWFVALAVHRQVLNPLPIFINLNFSQSFGAWYHTYSTITASSLLEDHLPPNDVVMVWHAYLLNPGLVSYQYA
jgi:hypothetical protein